MTSLQTEQPSEHWRLTEAGWGYRINGDRGWAIYRDPETGAWHTRDEAIRILEAKKPPDSRAAVWQVAPTC